MNETPSTTNSSLHEAVATYHVAVPASIPPTEEDLFYSDGKYVSEEDYFTYFYEFGDVNYEWNNGILEAKPMADVAKARMYAWFFRLVQAFLDTHPIAGYILLEIGFRMVIPDPDIPGATKRVIRKPDLGIVLKDNPIPLNDGDKTYQGICDLCIESVSDSTQKEIDRDIIDKKSEYNAGGVKEYFIIDDTKKNMHFYRRNDLGKYLEVKPDAEDVIHSRVLKGFKFRVADLHRQPLLIEMALDPLYRSFVLPEYYEAQRQKEEAQRRTEEAQRQKEEAQRQKEEALREAEEEKSRADRYKELLRKNNIDPDSLI
ncbi:MAG: Uma2 family endonuclease [Chloroflexota bacterium]